MSIPKAVSETIAALRTERTPLAARLDAIDLAIENLSRVYGLHGTPQPVPLSKAPHGRVKPETEPRNTEAQARRDIILALIGKAEYGLTAADLRKGTAKMADKDRSNALSVLRMSGKIKRAGNTWTRVTE